MNELHLFAGAGGGILAGQLLGHRCIGAVEINDYCRRVLMQRQDDGIFEPFPIWSDITTFDGRPWAGRVDIVAGGFPCQDISAAGTGAGIEGERSGLWSEMARVIREIRPRYVFVENSPMLTSRGLGTVLGDLAKMGFDAEWCVLGADDVGAPHRRKRIWILGYTNDNGQTAAEVTGSVTQGGNNSSTRTKQASEFARSSEQYEDVADAKIKRLARHRNSATEPNQGSGKGYAWTEASQNGSWWEADPGLDRVVDGMADRNDRITALGNGQVPLCAATAWRILFERL